MSLDEKIVDLLEEMDYEVHDYIDEQDGLVELERYTPAGEDWVFDLFFDGTLEGFAKETESYHKNFDINESVEVYIPARGTRGVPSSIRVLVEDAEWKKAQLKELSDAAAKLRDNPDYVIEIRHKHGSDMEAITFKIALPTDPALLDKNGDLNISAFGYAGGYGLLSTIGATEHVGDDTVIATFKSEFEPDLRMISTIADYCSTPIWVEWDGSHASAALVFANHRGISPDGGNICIRGMSPLLLAEPAPETDKVVGMLSALKGSLWIYDPLDD